MALNIDDDEINNPEDLAKLKAYEDALAFGASTEKADLTRKLYYGCMIMNVILVTLLILALALDMANTTAVLFSIFVIFIFASGQVCPRSPWKPNHFLSPERQMMCAEIFFCGMFLFFLWTWIGAIVSYVYVEDFIEEYCKDCIEEECGCDEMCEDDEQALKTLSYVIITVSVVVGSLLSVIFARWIAALAAILEREFPDSKNGFTPYLHIISLPNMDSAFCCCCPGRQNSCYHPSEWGKAMNKAGSDAIDAAEDAGEAAVTLCENVCPIICCGIFITSYILAGVICYGNSGGWFQVACCVYFFVVYIFMEAGSSN